jgi:methionine-gamma-lyase
MKPPFRPESLMMTHGHSPKNTEGAIKSPIFQTSTFAFESAEQGKAFFEVMYGLREARPDEKIGMIYSRLNNPNVEVAEQRLCIWEGAEEAALLSSGMAAISTVLLSSLSPGDLLLYSRPLYGGTDHFIHHYLPSIGVRTMGFKPGEEDGEVQRRLEESGDGEALRMIYVETPANPTNDLIDIAACRKIADQFSSKGKEVLIAADNTYMGPLWQQPLQLGADFVLYSATKYLGGHSDIIAGAILGNSNRIKTIKSLRTFLGNTADPFSSWLLLRSLETLKVRLSQQQENAKQIADYLQQHPKVKRVNYLGLLAPGSREGKLFQRQYSGSGAMLSFEIKGAEPEAFAFLNQLQLIKLAVSLGSTESLAQHPKTMTHSDVSPADCREMNITDALIRMSVGIEHIDDLISDLQQALAVIADQ